MSPRATVRNAPSGRWSAGRHSHHRDRSALGRSRIAARAAAWTDGVGALVSTPPRRRQNLTPTNPTGIIMNTLVPPNTLRDIDIYTDTRDILAHARKDAVRRGIDDWFIADIDAHHVEVVSWKEILEICRGSRGARAGADLPARTRRRAAVRAERRPGPALPGRRRPHSAPERPPRNRQRNGGASRRHANAPRDEFFGHRLHGGVSDAHAVPRPASADRHGGVAFPRL